MENWKVLELGYTLFSNNLNISVMTIILILNPKHNNVPATRKEINSISLETKVPPIFNWK